MMLRPEDEGAMTFKEIGRHLGITQEAARMTYMRAIQKLRSNPQALRLLVELSIERQRVKSGMASV